MGRYFFITIDTESDNQWNLSQKQTTDNAHYIPRFQDCCEEFGFIPTYFIDYSMANDDFLRKYLGGKAKNRKCEVGMHLHAWDTPPIVTMDKESTNRPYLIEYPTEIMEKKIKNLTDILENSFGTSILSHRAGRWAINQNYMSILAKYGYKVDCSVTPGIDWSKQIGGEIGGTDYSEKHGNVFFQEGDILELPVTICRMRHTYVEKKKGIVKYTKDVIKSCIGKQVWLRPSLSNINDMLKLVDMYSAEEKYLEFMIHSSEFMPGGSPYYPTTDSVDYLFDTLKVLFKRIKEKGYKGAMVKDAITLFEKKEIY